MPFAEELDDFYKNDEHGTQATYLAATINGIFSNQYIETADFQGTVPTYRTKFSNVSGGIGNTIVINSVSYEIREIQQDVSGTEAELTLKEI